MDLNYLIPILKTELDFLIRRDYQIKSSDITKSKDFEISKLNLRYTSQNFNRSIEIRLLSYTKELPELRISIIFRRILDQNPANSDSPLEAPSFLELVEWSRVHGCFRDVWDASCQKLNEDPTKFIKRFCSFFEQLINTDLNDIAEGYTWEIIERDDLRNYMDSPPKLIGVIQDKPRIYESDPRKK